MDRYEGFDTETAEGRAILACTPSRVCEPSDGRDLLEFLLPLRPGRALYVAHNADYDVRAILKWLPPTCWAALYYDGRYEWHGYKISYIAGKRFTVSRGRRRAALYDSWSFTQMPLERAASDILGLPTGKDPIPRAWLRRMGELQREGGWRWRRVVRYCMRDAELAELLFRNIQRSFERAGLPFRDPLSPGSLSGTYFARYTRGLAIPMDESFAQVYYGGRIEAYERGRIAGPLYNADLNSAYPWSMSLLQDPRGLWCGTRDGEPPEDAVYGMVYAEVNDSRMLRYGPFPVRRRDGSIAYPVGLFRTWVTLPEYLAAREHWNVRALTGYYYMGESGPLFPTIPELYRERLSNPELSPAYKLILNSSYGKLAQKVRKWTPTTELREGAELVRHRGRWMRRYSQRGGHSYMMLASHVTGLVRARLLTDVLAPDLKAGENVLFLATDGALLRDPFAARLGRVDGLKRLGAWSIDRYDDAVIVGSGVYSLRYGAKTVEKRRGFPGGFNLRTLLRGRRRPWVAVPLMEVDSLAQTVSGDRPELMNVLRRARRRLDVNFDGKRVWDDRFRAASQLLTDRHTSIALHHVEKEWLRDEDERETETEDED